MLRAYTLGSVTPAVPTRPMRVQGPIAAASPDGEDRAAPVDSTEIHEADGAFDRIEAWLRERGFFAPGGEKLVADLYLGYGLSSTIRRQRAAPPPEPCPLPLAACSIRSVRRKNYVVEYDNERKDEGIAFGPWQQTWRSADYTEAVRRVRDAIASGDVYQVNLVQHLSATFAGDPGTVAARLATLNAHNREPYRGNGWAVVSGSPELFLARRGRRVWTCPIKGTRPAGAGGELAASAKDVAEHMMIVDLERNDLSRVCEPGSVRWPELMVTRALVGVEHMISTVEGRLRDGVGLAELLRATFPGGSITGAPKIAAVDLIAQLEPVGRGASMGALGRVYGNGDLDLALTIRTFAIAAGRIHLWVGGGVVWDSDPQTEVDESWIKADPLLRAIGAPRAASGKGLAGPDVWRPGDV
jgi:para-aminobenzoate synthetase component I